MLRSYAEPVHAELAAAELLRNPDRSPGNAAACPLVSGALRVVSRCVLRAATATRCRRVAAPSRIGCAIPVRSLCAAFLSCLARAFSPVRLPHASAGASSVQLTARLAAKRIEYERQKRIGAYVHMQQNGSMSGSIGASVGTAAHGRVHAGSLHAAAMHAMRCEISHDPMRSQ